MSGRLTRLQEAMRWMVWRLANWPRSKAKARSEELRPVDDEGLRIIVESPLFDASWYVQRYPSVAASGLSPHEHYLRKGASKGLKPSQSFNPVGYLAAHPEASGVNPILHVYRTVMASSAAETKRLGVAAQNTARGDGVPIVARPEELRSAGDDDLRIIVESPLFDAPWYVQRYSAVAASGLSPHEHYLRKGAPKGLKPSEALDPVAYLEAHPEAAELNPIVHAYRAMTASSAAEAERLGAASSDGFPIVARPEGEPDRRRVFGPPRESFGDPDTAIGDRGSVALEAFRRLSGLCPPHDTGGTGGAWFDSDALRAAGAWLREGSCRLDDAWHLDGDTRLRLRFAGNENGRRQHHVAAFQVGAQDVPPELVLVGEAIVGEGPVFVDLLLADPLMPVLLLSRPASGARPGDAEAAVIAFPSLLRGGLHYAELAASVPRITTMTEAFARWDEALCTVLTPTAAPFAVARVVASPGGSGPMAQGALTHWLGTVFGVAVGEAAPAREGGGVLHLPSDAVPTLSALLARHEGDDVRLGAFLVADPVTRAPRYAIALPAAVAALDELQPHEAEPLPLLSPDDPASGPAVGATAFPLAIRFRPSPDPDAWATPGTAPRLKRPFDPDGFAADDLVVLLFARDADRTANLLEDLSAQTLAPLTQIRIAPLRPDAFEGPAAEAAVRLGDRCSVLDPIGPALADRFAAARAAGGRYVLLVSDSVTVPDPHTLETLVVLAEADGVGAASCLLLERSFSGGRAGPTVAAGGWLATGISFMTAPAVTFGRPDVLGALPKTTFPVAAAGPELALFRAEALADLDGMTPNPVNDAALLQLALANAAEGRSHLITTAVHAFCLDPIARRDVPDPAGPSAIQARHLVEIVDRVTAVREVKG